MTKREKWADLVKGIGIILVILGHVKYTDEHLRVWLYSFHMPLFFFISGYFMKPKINLYKDIIHKAKTLLIPYFTLSILSYVIEYFLNLIVYNKVKFWNVDSIIGFFIQLPPHNIFESPCWFFGCLFVASVLFLLLIYCLKENKRTILLISTIITILEVLLIEKIRLPWNIDISLLMLVFMASGYYINKQNILEKYNNFNLRKKLIIVLVCGVLGFVFCYINYQANDNRIDYYMRELNNELTCYLAGFFNILFVVFICNFLANRSKIVCFSDLEYVGKNSAIYYVISANGIHIGYAFIIVMQNILPLYNNMINTIVTFIITLVIPVPIITLLNKFFPFFIGKTKE